MSHYRHAPFGRVTALNYGNGRTLGQAFDQVTRDRGAQVGDGDGEHGE